MNFQEFRSFRMEMKEKNPSLLDLAETNVYKGLPQAFPKVFHEIQPSQDVQAEYRCHISENFLDFLGLSREMKPRTMISAGVRASLAALMSFAKKERKRVSIPSDVYPMYLEICRAEGVEPQRYDSRFHEIRQILPSSDWVLVCDPLKPWGGRLSSEEWDDLLKWRRDTGGVIIVDAVYDLEPDEKLMAMARKGEVVFLSSLSKGWLVPNLSGICVLPSDMSEVLRPYFALLPKDTLACRRAFHALTELKDRPRLVKECLLDLSNRFDEIREEWWEASPVSGYFAVSQHSWQEFLAKDILVLPASVFGSKKRGSVLSTLPPVKVHAS